MMEEKKFIESINVDDWEVLTDTGWEDVVRIHKTIPYQVWRITTKSFELECADKHLVFDENMFPIYVEELYVGKKIQTKNGLEEIVSIENSSYEANMYDLELSDKTNHRYYTNGILSHNTATSSIFILWYATVHPYKQILITSQDMRSANEILTTIKQMYEYCPNFVKQSIVKMNESELWFSNGSRIFSRASNNKAARGLSPAIIYCDEFALVGTQDSASKARSKQDEFFASITPALSASHGKLIITSTPISESDLFYSIWSNAIKKTDDKGLDLPKDYIISINDELWKDYHVFHSEEDAKKYLESLGNPLSHKYVEFDPVGNNGYQTVFATWDKCPFKTQEWAEKEAKVIGQERFSREFNCISKDTKINLLDENGIEIETTIENAYNLYMQEKA